MTLSKAIICEIDSVLSDDSKRRHWIKEDLNTHIPFRGEWGGAGLKFVENPDFQIADWEAYYSDMDKDEVNEVVRQILFNFYQDEDDASLLLFVTGRPEKYREVTLDWLYRHGFNSSPRVARLFMRPDCCCKECHCLLTENHLQTCLIEKDPSIWIADHRPAHEVKREIYEREIKSKYEVLFCLDDDEECCEMYKELGLNVLRVL